jgi:Nucleotidyl transferase AbiEii toxin, Type IV TA system
MTGKEFLNRISNGETDIIQELLSILEKTGSDYCLIGGLAVNAYAEPVVSLDLDLVVAADETEKICREAQTKGFKLEKFEHSINLTRPKSDLRIQLQTDNRYQEFISRASLQDVLGYKMKVAALDDLIQGKIWAYSDPKRRRSKKQKDLADIARLVESYPDLETRLPESIRKALG